MSTVINEGVNMSRKAVTTQTFIAVGLIFEVSKTISKPKGYIEASNSIRKPSVTVTSNSPVIYSSLFSYFFFSSLLKTKSRYHKSRVCQWSTFESEFRNWYSLCRPRDVAGKMNRTASRNYLSIIDLIKERYCFFEFLVSVVKVLLKKPGSICSKNSLIPINLS